MGMDKDLPPGEKLVVCFRPFLEGLVASDLSPKTIQKHVESLWALGEEIIRDLHENPSLRRKTSEQILTGDRIDDEGGPMIYYRFLSQSPAESDQIHAQLPPTRQYLAGVCRGVTRIPRT